MIAVTIKPAILARWSGFIRRLALIASTFGKKLCQILLALLSHFQKSLGCARIVHILRQTTALLDAFPHVLEGIGFHGRGNIRL